LRVVFLPENRAGRVPMARGDQLGRQWRIIQTLITSRAGKSAAGLAEELECNPRTVYRDLEALQVAGFPIYTERVEGKNLWSLLDTMKHQMPVPFSITELMALYFSRDMLKVFKDTVFYDSLESLFKKVKTTLPPGSARYLDQVEQTFHVGIKPYKDYGRFREILSLVQDAAVSRKTIDMVYHTMSRKKETRRRVDPYRVWFFNGTFYLIGHCHMREEVRVFALDRVKLMSVTKDSFEPPEGFSLDEFLRPSFGVFQGAPVKVKIWFSSGVAGYIKEKIWHESQVIVTRKDGSIVFEAEVAGTEEVKFWVMGWGAHARVLEPESLTKAIQSQAEAVAALYGPPSAREEERSAR
jgi:predicted DNA-binding transcriptional regulator YafY